MSASPSVSPSVSESPSVSPSVSASPSVSPSVSVSPSISISPSASVSPSVSVSPSPSASPDYDGSLTLVITHNLGDPGNSNQVEDLKNLLTTVVGTDYDVENIHYELNNLDIFYETKVYQIIPYGVTAPANYIDLVSYNVFYGTGDSDKTGTHPRFFNWGLKRGIDNSNDYVFYVTSLSSLNMTTFNSQISSLQSNANIVMAENPAGYILKRAVLAISQLDESLTFSNAISDLKTRITNAGYSYISA